MRAVSQDFLATLRGSHLVDAELELYFPEAPATPVIVPALEGQITIDRTSTTRRSGSVVIPWTVAAQDLLGGVDIRTLPLGGYVIPKRGILYSSGQRELVELGWLRCESVTWSEVGQRATLELADRTAQLADEPFASPYSASSKRVATAAYEIASGVFGPSIAYSIEYDPPTILSDALFSDSRVNALVELARSAGAEWYFDAAGDFVFDVAAGGVAVTLVGTLTDNAPVVTGLASTAELAVGMTCTGLGVPSARRIASIDSSSQVTLNAPANISSVKNSRTAVGSPVVVDIVDTDDLSPGMTVTGPAGYIAAATTIVAIRPSELTLSKAALKAGYPLLTYSSPASSSLLFAGSASAYPVWQIDAGEAGILIDTAESLDRTAVYNGVLVTGQATSYSPAFSVLVTDSDPYSPTRWGGPFGHVLRVESSTAIQTAAQGTIVGQTLLNEGLGLTRSLTITSAPNPALEAGDTVLVVFDDGRVEKHLVDVVVIDLGTGSIQLATRTTAKPADIEGRELGLAWAPLAERTRTFTGSDVWAELRRRHVRERVLERSR